MTTLWVSAALLAGLLQAWRTAVQQRLRATLSVNAAGLVRYLYGAPVILVLLAGYRAVHGAPAGQLSAWFVLLCGLAGLAQVLATNLLIMAFGYRNFVVGTALSKTETIQAAAFGWIVLGETPGWLLSLAIAIGVAGVLLLALGGRALGPSDILRSLGQPASLCGLASGGLFALTGVLIRLAASAFDGNDPILSGLSTLGMVVVLQTTGLSAWVLMHERASRHAVARGWRTSAQVGLLSAIGSACLFTALAIAPVAQVRIVAQVEVVFTLASAHLYLREAFQWREWAGLLLVACGVLLALAGIVLR